MRHSPALTTSPVAERGASPAGQLPRNAQRRQARAPAGRGRRWRRWRRSWRAWPRSASTRPRCRTAATGCARAAHTSAAASPAAPRPPATPRGPTMPALLADSRARHLARRRHGAAARRGLPHMLNAPSRPAAPRAVPAHTRQRQTRRRQRWRQGTAAARRAHGRAARGPALAACRARRQLRRTFYRPPCARRCPQPRHAPARRRQGPLRTSGELGGLGRAPARSSAQARARRRRPSPALLRQRCLPGGAASTWAALRVRPARVRTPGLRGRPRRPHGGTRRRAR
jgi:hypothetical protein